VNFYILFQFSEAVGWATEGRLAMKSPVATIPNTVSGGALNSAQSINHFPKFNLFL